MQRRGWLGALAALALLPFLFAWLVATSSGLASVAWLAEGLSGGRLSASGAEGSLLGPLRIRQLEFKSADLAFRLEDFVLAWQPGELSRGRLRVEKLSVRLLEVATKASGEPPKLPADLSLPFAVEAPLQVGTLRVSRWQTTPPATPLAEFTGLSARVASDGRRHRLDDLQFASPWGAVTGRAGLDGVAPFPLEASVALAGQDRGKAYRLEAGAAGPLADFRVTADASGLDLKGHGELQATPFAAVPFTRLVLDLGELDPAALKPGAPRAALTLKADLKPVSGPGQPLRVEGPLSLTNRLPGPLDRNALPLASATARTGWQGERLELMDIDLALAGDGHARGRASWTQKVSKAELTLFGVNLASLHTRLKPTRLGGPVRLASAPTGDSLTAELAEPRFAVSLAARRSGDALSLDKLALRAKGASLSATGNLALAGQRAFAASGRLEHFDPALLFATVPGDLNARFDAKGQLEPRWAADLSFNLARSRYAGRPAAGQGRLRLAPGRLAGVDLGLELAGNTLAARGAYGAPGDQLQVSLNAPRLADLPLYLAGQLKLDATLTGSPDNPAGQAELHASGLRLPGGLHLASLEGRANLQPGQGGGANASLKLGELKKGDTLLLRHGDLDLAGTRNRHTLRGELALPKDGTLSLALAGGLAPDRTWRGTLDRLDLAGAGKYHLAAPAPLQAGPERVSLGWTEIHSTDTRLLLAETGWTPTEITSKGELSGLLLRLAPTPGRKAPDSEESLRLGANWNLRLGSRADGDVRIFREGGDLMVLGDAPARLGLSRLELLARLEQDRLRATLEAAGSRLGTLHARAATRLSGTGFRRLPDPLAPLEGGLELDTPNLDWLGPLLAPSLGTGGRLQARMEIGGSVAQPRARGSLSGDDLRIDLADQGLHLIRGSLRASFDEARLRVDTLAFETASKPVRQRSELAALKPENGTLGISGELALATGQGELYFTAKRLAVLQTEERWLLLSGEGKAHTGWQSLGLTGKFKADAAWIEAGRAGRAQLSDDVVVRGRQASGPGLKLDMDLEVALGRLFFLRGHGLETRLEGDLRLRASPGSPVRASGFVRTAGGTFDAYGQRLSIETGIANFQGPLDNPSLDVLALRKGQAVEAGVAVTGPAKKPRVKLVSTPDVPDQEKLSWIVLGRAPDQLSGNESSLLLSAAASLFAGQQGGPGITRRIAEGLGLDTLSVGSGRLGGITRLPSSAVVGGASSATGATAADTQIVSLGKRLSSSASLSFEQSLAGAGSIVSLTYNLSRRLSVVGRAGADNAVDLYYTFSFR